MAKEGKKKHNLLIILGIIFILGLMGSCSDGDSSSSDTNSPEDVSVEEEQYPEFVESDYDKAIFDTLKDNGNELLDLRQEETLIASVYCSNSEDDVNAMLDALSPVVTEQGEGSDLVVVVYDGINVDEDIVLANCAIHADGSHEITSHHADFMTAHKAWVSGQFNGWDGSHIVLTDLIKDSMNDPSSYEHVETTYVDIQNEEVLQQMRDIFASGGYSTDLQIGDLVITTTFRGTNAFGGVVTNDAIGVAHEATDTIELVDMG